MRSMLFLLFIWKGRITSFTTRVNRISATP